MNERIKEDLITTCKGIFAGFLFIAFISVIGGLGYLIFGVHWTFGFLLIPIAFVMIFLLIRFAGVNE